MRDAVAEAVAPGLFRPLRKCEWCRNAARRGKDLCLDCAQLHVDEVSVPFDAGDTEEIHFALYRLAAELP